MQYSFFRKKEEDDEGRKEDETTCDPSFLAALSQLQKGSELNLLGLSIKEGETSPPKRYTSGSMILAMENAGQLIEDEELREQIKGSGIGTSATAGLILLAAAGGYAGVGALLCIPLFPENRDQRTELRRADRRAGQRGNSEAHCGLYTQHYRARWKTETLSGTEIGLTYVDDHAVEKLLESQNTLAWPAFYWKEKENQVAADSVV